MATARPLPLPSPSSRTTLPRHPTLRPRASLPTPEALNQIRNSGIIACLRAPNSQLAVEAARAALTSGISVLEIVMSTPGALQSVRELSCEFPSSIIGVGTVLNARDAADAVEAGAKFMMSPVTLTEVLKTYAGREDVLYIPGAMTPTEIMGAYDMGARMVKIYPVSVLGGAEYLSVLRKPLGHIPVIASQGVSLESMEEYISGGAAAVVLSDAIFGGEAMRKKDLDAVRVRAGIAASRGRRAVEGRRSRC